LTGAYVSLNRIIMKSWIQSSLVILVAIGMSEIAQAGEAPTTFVVSEFTFTRPAPWDWVPTTSMMRKAELKMADRESGGVAEVVFFHFGPGDGGGTQANVERWFRMFREPRDRIQARSEEIEVRGHVVTYVRAEGTYMSGMPGGPQTPMPGYGLAGAIIESKAGNVFVRLTGPKGLVETLVPDFKKMIESGLKQADA
jgi:hypothetical protein